MQRTCIDGARNPMLGDQRGHQLGRRDVKGGVVRRAARRRDSGPGERRHLVIGPVLDLDVAAARGREVDRGHRRGNHERHPVVVREHGEPVGAHLVGDAAVGGNAVRSGQHQVHFPGGHQRRRRGVGQHRVRDAGPPGLVGGQPGTLQQRAGLIHPQPGHPPRPVRREDDRERGALAGRHQGTGVAVGQDAAPVPDQAEPVPGDGRARRGIRRLDRPRLRQRGRRRAPPARCGVPGLGVAGCPVGGQGPHGAPAQVHRGRPGPAQRVCRRCHIVAAVGGQRDTVRPGQAQQRGPADHEPSYRLIQGRDVAAEEIFLLGRQPGLVQQHNRRPVRRVEPAQRAGVHSPSVRHRRSPVEPGHGPAPETWNTGMAGAPFHRRALRASMGASAGRARHRHAPCPVRRNMTDNVPPGGNGTGEGGNGGGPQPWFPPAGEPGGYAPPPYQHGQEPPAGGYGQPPEGYGAPGGSGQGGRYGQGGGYGQGGPGQPRYAPWPSQPQAPKPGVIPLRPLGVGELLDGAFTSIRRNPRATLGIAALLLTASAVITTTVSLVLAHYVGSVTLPSPGQQLTDAQATRLLTWILEVLVPTAAVSAVLTFVIGRLVLGRKITAGEAWRIARPRIPALIGTTLLIPLILLGVWAVYAVVLVILAVAHAPGALIGFLAVLGAIAGIVLTIWFAVMFRMAAPAVVLEREGPARALARSWRLVHGSFWRVLGITLLASLIVVVTAGVLQIPFGLLAAAAGGGNSLLPSTGGNVASILISAVGGVVAGAVARPISAGVAVLLYVDLRMRREGLDLVLQTAAGGDAAPTGDEYASLWRPGVQTARPGPEGPPGPGAGAGPGTGAGHGPVPGPDVPPDPGVPPGGSPPTW